LKKPPKVEITNNNIIINVSDSGFMDQSIMQDYINRVILPYTRNANCLLVLDDFSAHKIEGVFQYMKERNISPLLIPGGYTYCLQPLDVSINKPFKDSLRKNWKIWYGESNKFTKGGNKSKPSWQQTISMVDKATKQISADNIRNSFKHCGFDFSANSDNRAFIHKKWFNGLNHHLKNILTFEEDWSKEFEVFEDFKQLTPYKHISRIELIAQDEQPDLEGGEDNDEDYDDYFENEIQVNSSDLIDETIAYVISSSLEDEIEKEREKSQSYSKSIEDVIAMDCDIDMDENILIEGELEFFIL
jgi:hypothetical protein